MNRIYNKSGYNIYAIEDEYIVHNTKKDFKDGHSHIRNYKTAVFIIDLCIHKSIPRHLNTYLLRSLYRISDDEEYRSKLDEYIKNKNSKTKQYYYNRGNKQKKNYPKRHN